MTDIAMSSDRVVMRGGKVATDEDCCNLPTCCLCDYDGGPEATLADVGGSLTVTATITIPPQPPPDPNWPIIPPTQCLAGQHQATVVLSPATNQQIFPFGVITNCGDFNVGGEIITLVANLICSGGSGKFYLSFFLVNRQCQYVWFNPAFPGGGPSAACGFFVTYMPVILFGVQTFVPLYAIATDLLFSAELDTFENEEGKCLPPAYHSGTVVCPSTNIRIDWEATCC